MKSILKNAVILLGIVVFVSSCEVDVTSPDDLQKSSKDVNQNIETEMSVISVFDDVNNYGFNNESLKSALLSDNKIEVTWDGNLKMTLDFTNVEDASGKIVVKFSSTPGYTEGLTATVVFDGYQNEGMGLSGEMKLTVEEKDDETVKLSVKSVGDLTVTKGDLNYLWACNQTYLWFEGFSTLSDNADDAFMINGTATQTIDTVANKMTLTDIVSASDCKFIKDGDMELVTNSNGDKPQTITCDFGINKDGEDKGDCDGWIKIISNGITLKINME
jgi:hypothetical protein